MSSQAHPQVGPAPELVVDAISIANLIHSISNRMTATGTAAYARFGLGFLEARILYVLARTPPMPSSMLAMRLAVDRAAISRAVSRLTGEGLIELVPKRCLSLTAQGQALSVAITGIFEDRCLRLIDGLSDPARIVVLEHLRLLQRNVLLLAALPSEETVVSNGDTP